MNAPKAPPGDDLDQVERLVNPAQVAHVRATMPTPQILADLADVFSLLGDPARVRILTVLLPGRMSVRDIAAVVHLSESGVSHALRLLRAHRVVDVHREGRVAYYALADSHVRFLLDVALEHVGHTVLVHPARDTGADGQGNPAGCLAGEDPEEYTGHDAAQRRTRPLGQ